MKKKITILALLACVFSLFVTVFAVTTANTAKADGETYSLTFEVPTDDYDMASSLDTWKRHNTPETNDEGGLTMYRDPSLASGTVVNYAGGMNRYTVALGKTYIVKYSVKSESVCFNFAVETPEWKTLFSGWVRSPSEYIEESFEYTPTQAGNLSFIFQFTAGGGNVYVKDLYLYEKETKEVTAGAAIGELPAIPSKEGCLGRWIVGGDILTSDSVYNYGEDKTARVEYALAHTLTFLPVEYDYDMASSSETWTRYNKPVVNDEGGVTLTRKASDSGNVNYAAGVQKYNIEAGKQYIAEISLKAENVRYVLSTEKPDWSWKVVPDKGVVTDTDYVTYKSEYTASKSGLIEFIFQLISGEGNLYVRNFRFYEKIEKQFTEAKEIGELPEIPEKEGYVGYWDIDGDEITENSTYYYGRSKTATIKYVEIVPFAFEYETVSASADGWTTDTGKVTCENETLTLDLNTVGNAYRTIGGLTEGKTYTVSLDYKGSGAFHVFNISSKWNLIRDWIRPSSDWNSVTATFVAGANNKLCLQKASAGVAEIKNFAISEVRTLRKGEAVGELPAVPEKAGYVGTWTVGGEALTADRICEAAETAVVSYKKISAVSFVSDLYDYDMAKDLESWKIYNVPTAGENGEAVLNRPEGLDGGKAYNYLAGVDKLPITEGAKYVLSFDMKSDNIHMNIALDSPAWTMLGSAWFNNPSYVHYSYEYTAAKDGFATVIFQTDAGSGNVYVKNLRFYRIFGSLSVTEGNKLGVLPEISGLTAKHGYKFVWTVGGEEITADTVCNFTDDKIARIAETAIDGHAMTKVGAVKATCELDGVKEYYACECGKKFEDENGYNEITDFDAWKADGGKIAATGHTVEKVNGESANCIKDGFKDYYRCTVCNKNFADEAAENSIADLDAWKAGDGKIAANGHTVEKVEEVKATCTENGVKAYYRCAVCGKNFTDEAAENAIVDLDAWKAGDGKIAANGHSVEKVEEVKATCTENGVKAYYRCTVCGKNFTDEVAENAIADLDAWKAGDGKIAAVHDFATDWSKDETNHWHACKVCGEKEGEAAHTFDDGVVTTPATCVKNGVKTFTCTVCGETKTEAIDKIEHKFSAEWSEDGKTHWHACEVCGEKADEAEHTYGDGVVTKEATIDAEGEITYTCTECGATKTEKTEAVKDWGCISGIGGSTGYIALVLLASAAIVVFAKRAREE